MTRTFLLYLLSREVCARSQDEARMRRVVRRARLSVSLGLAMGRRHELLHGSIHRDRVRDWRNRSDHITAVGLRAVEATHPRPFHVALVLIKAFAVGLPEIEHRPRNRLAVEAVNLAGHEAGNAGRTLRH